MGRFTQDYEDFCVKFTDAPKTFHRFSAYYLISSVLGRKVYMVTGDRRLYPNLWICCVAPSSFYRKSTSQGIARKMLEEVSPGFSYPNEFSHEKLLDIFQTQPEGAFFYDEASNLFSILGKEYNRGAEAMFTTLYGGGFYKRVTGVKTIEIRDPYINIMGASTLQWLVDSVTESSMTGGFLPRFLFVAETDKTQILPFQPPADRELREKLIEMLSGIAKIACEFKLSPEAMALHCDWYTDFVNIHETKPEKLKPFLARLAGDAILKLCMIMAVDRGELGEVTVSAWTEAKLTVELLARRLENVLIDELGTDDFQRDLRKIQKLIESVNGEGLARSEIYRHLVLPKRRLDEIIDTLICANRIERVDFETKTRHGVYYRAVRQ